MWNERYDSEEYAYGTEPNGFLKENASYLEGPVLSIAEGEGRNAVFLASLGLNVLGVDGSEVGLKKAQMLAQSKGIDVETEVADLEHFSPGEGFYGSVVSISAHLPSRIRHQLYPRLERALKPGGILLLEAYAEAQLRFETGGPQELDLLMSVEKIQTEFPNLEVVALRQVEREVIEGAYHTGLSAVVQFIGRKSPEVKV
ncbi:class I SAM-dependent methyltransferase [Kiritimatiellaeota bacterium B1221]|nr:class I SAM-dependent methyltransferase [Kiritimatiellaeota bacterium B1221]